MTTTKPKELTDPACRNAKPRDKPWKLHDVRGLFLLVNPSGTKWWRFRYKLHGKDGLLSLGVYPDVPLADARKQRDKARELIAKGMNPAEARREEKRQAEAGSFKAVFEDWFEVRRPDWADANIKKIQRIAGNDLLPWLGTRQVKEIKAPELLACLRRVESRGALEWAQRACQIANDVFIHAIATGRAETNPAASLVKALKKPVRGQRAAITDPAQLSDLLRAFEHYRGGLVVKKALYLSALTFVRPGELRQMEWADVDFDRAEWFVNVESRKLTKVQKRTAAPHWVPLAPQAVSHLRELQALTGRGRYVFPNGRDGARPMSDGAVVAALRALGVDKQMMSAHGFRGLCPRAIHQGSPPDDGCLGGLPGQPRQWQRQSGGAAQGLSLRR